jgi:hypothetical protein
VRVGPFGTYAREGAPGAGRPLPPRGAWGKNSYLQLPRLNFCACCSRCVWATCRAAPLRGAARGGVREIGPQHSLAACICTVPCNMNRDHVASVALLAQVYAVQKGPYTQVTFVFAVSVPVVLCCVVLCECVCVCVCVCARCIALAHLATYLS